MRCGATVTARSASWPARARSPGAIPRRGSNRNVHDGQYVSGNCFKVLGVWARPSGGRSLPADDSIERSGGPQGPVAMLSYRYWTRAFQRDPSVTGRSINVNGAWLTVIALRLPEFFGVQVGGSPDVFVPMQLQPARDRTGQSAAQYQELRDYLGHGDRAGAGGTFADQVKADLTPLFAEYELTRMSPADHAAYLAGKKPLFAKRRVRTCQPRLFAAPRAVLRASAGADGAGRLVLLIACANLANLLLARANAANSETLSPGDGMFLFSDGVTEAQAPDESFYGIERLEALLRGLTSNSPSECVDRVVGAVNSFAEGAPPADDLTVLALRRPGA